MKRLLRTDPIGIIKLLVYCEDITKGYPSEILGAEEKYTPNQEDLDNMYLGYDDASLRNIPQEEIQKIRNMSLIQRIGRLDKTMYNMLSHNQRLGYAQYAKNYHWLTKKDIPLLVKKLHECQSIESLYVHNRTVDFKFQHHLTDSDLLEIIHSIKSSDFDETNSQLNYHPDYYGDPILEFKLPGIKLTCGKDLSAMILYVKLDHNRSDNTTVVYISIHEDIYNN